MTAEPRLSISHESGFFPSRDGLSLYYQHWWNAALPIRAILVIVHGLGGHSGLFSNVIEALVPQGYAIYAPDLRGHGRSPGPRGFIHAWSEFRGDVDALVELAVKAHPEPPIFLMGHSVGGAIVLDYALRLPPLIQGVIVSNPALGAVGISPIKLAIGKLLSQVWPRFSLSTGIELATGARDPQLVKTYEQDPLRHAIGSARLATEFLATTEWIYGHMADWRLPLLLLQSGADAVTLPAGSQRFFAGVIHADKTWKSYPESYHEIYDDLDYELVLRDVSQWLSEHTIAPLSP